MMTDVYKRQLFCNAFLYIFFVFIKCIEFRYILSEFIIDLRKFFLLDLVNFNFEDCSFACKFFSLVIFRESNIYFYIRICCGTNKLIFE